MRTAKLSSKSQIVIPAEVRRQLGICPGDTLAVAVEGDRIVLSKESPESALARLEAFVGDPRFRGLPEEIEGGRNEWEEYSREIERARHEPDE